jgi:hypothetical protein
MLRHLKDTQAMMGEDLSQDVNENLKGHEIIIEKVAETLLQSSGYADLYGLQENSASFTERRSSECEKKSVIIAEKRSPGNSPSTGQFNAMLNTLKSFEKDDPAAVRDDIQNFKDIKDEVKEQLLSDLAGGD